MDKIYIFISLALLLSFILFKEFNRANKTNLILRISASVFAIISLYFIISPLTFNRKVSSNYGDSAIFLTEGYHRDSLIAWKGIPIFSTEKSISEQNKNVRFIANIQQFTEKNPKYKNIHVFGYGLENYELEQLATKNLILHPSPLADGISAINWTEKIQSGESLSIQGDYINAKKREIKIILRGLGNNLDSIIIDKEKSHFELKCIPKHLDKAVYSLIALSNSDTLIKEKLPVLVKKKEPIRLLILASSPDFENKFLKNWLSEEGYSVVIRTSISKDKFNTEFVNVPKSDLSRINSTLLENFDLVIGDIQELSSLSNSESLALQNQVNKGLGLIIKSNVSPSKNSLYSKSFNILENKKAFPKSMKLIWEGQLATKEMLPGSVFLTIIPQSGTQSLVKNESGDILISSKLFGEGKLILNLIQDSYTWILGNQKKNYSSFWTYILQKAAKKKEMASNYIFPKIGVINKEIVLQTDSSQLRINNDKIALIQDPTLQFEHKGIWWPKNIGWQSLDNEQDWFYIFGESDWNGVRASQKLRNTKMNLMFKKENINEEQISNLTYEEQVSSIWFYILFLLCCTYLWLEEKLS